MACASASIRECAQPRRGGLWRIQDVQSVSVAVEGLTNHGNVQLQLLAPFLALVSVHFLAHHLVWRLRQFEPFRLAVGG